jgi:hypothetical protein
MASQMQRRQNIKDQGLVNRPINRLSLAAVRDVWVENAQAIQDSSENGVTGMLYDKWFTDRAYRDEIAHQVGFTNTDAGLDYVPDPGSGGSSFDGTAFQDRAQEMKVLDRSRMFNEDEERRDLYVPLVTPQVIELNQELFGFDPSMSG